VAKKTLQSIKRKYKRNIDLGIDPECHECISHHVDKDGYARFKRDGFTLIHRWVHWNNTGEKPEEVMHSCDNRVCINPNHLQGGNHSKNMTEMNERRVLYA